MLNIVQSKAYKFSFGNISCPAGKALWKKDDFMQIAATMSKSDYFFFGWAAEHMASPVATLGSQFHFHGNNGGPESDSDSGCHSLQCSDIY